MTVIKRKFRMLQNSKEYESNGITSIESFNAGLDFYRVAPGDKLPLPWPHRRFSGHVKCRNILDELDNEIREILDREGISVQSISAYRLSPKYAPECAKETVVISSTDTPPDPSAVWKRAANDIWNLLEAATTPAGISFRLEIRNNDLMYRDISTAIPITLTILPQLLQLQPAINELVKNTMSGVWTSVSFHMRGPKEDSTNRTPTLIVTCKPKTRFTWEDSYDTLFNEIQKLQVENQMHFTLAIEIFPTIICPSSFSDEDVDMLFPSHLPSSAPNGASIGPQDSQYPGSLGVWVFFQPTGSSEKQTCFITCYHVIASGDRINQSSNNVHGIGLNGQSVSKKIAVEYPAPVDSRHFRQRANLEIAEKKEVNDNMQLIATMDQYRITNGIGFVQHASGFRRTNENSRLDWALVAINPNVSSPGNLCPSSTLINNRLLVGTPRYKTSPNEVFKKVGNLEQDRWVGKIGRKTGITCGEMTKMKGLVKWENNLDSFEVQVSSLEFSETFATLGDSGSMVFNSKKEWVGLVIGSDLSTDFSFVTPAKAIIADIEAMTRGKITLI